MEGGKKVVSVCIIGTGHYGLAMASVMNDNPELDVHIRFYTRHQALCDAFNKSKVMVETTDLVRFRETASAHTSVQEAVQEVDFIFLCIPTQFVSTFLQDNREHFASKTIFVNCAKGMAIKEKKFISEIFAEQFPDRGHKYAVLSGPSFAEEIYDKLPTIVTIASKSQETLDSLQELMTAPYFKSYYLHDIIGVELCGAMKNVLALITGFVHGLGYKGNTTAAFVARGIKEISIFSKHYGADPTTVFSTCGVGDIMVTCYGELSRNRQCGLKVAQGQKLEDVIKEIGTVEGVPTASILCKVIQERGLCDKLKMIAEVYDLLTGKVDVKEGIDKLMTNRRHHEFEYMK